MGSGVRYRRIAVAGAAAGAVDDVDDDTNDNMMTVIGLMLAV